MEAFLVAHIYYHSKLEEFTSTDFIAICKLSPILFVFDGFDEIANVKVRSEVIEFINKGITRISANAKSMQVIITSRPAAFSGSVGFAIENYPHFELADITPTIINEYVEKWIKASKLDNRDASELRKLTKEKLEMPHLKDLAKSPMQLAIFINLLKTKGQSLPNKRTALYDSYIELFFDRESEKNTLIRDKRDLIIDIHQYLAWILHSEAELLKNNGRIQIDDLNTRLKEYLTHEGHDTAIADQLFNVMKERVCALVSRVQGTFEFEVQPLREYFCAKYLYKSAPHSSAGSVKHGTKPDRFHAILRDYYWQNVVRFFAGCADAGELDMIIQELKYLQNDDLLKYTNYPRIITSQILSDYVFTQKPLKLKDVVKIIVDGISVGNVINQDTRYGSHEPLLLPNECGRTEIINECFQQLIKFPNNDSANELIGILNNNPLNNLEKWLEFTPKFKGTRLTKWLEYAYKLQLIHKIDDEQLNRILKESDENQIKKRLQLIINGNRLELIVNDNNLKNMLFIGILNSELGLYERRIRHNNLAFLTRILDSFFWRYTFNVTGTKTTLEDILNRIFSDHMNSSKSLSEMEFTVEDEIDEKIKEFSNAIKPLYSTPVETFKNSIEPWDMFVEKGRIILKDNWSLNIVATIAAGIKSKENSYDNYAELNNTALSLCKRVRCARMKSGNIKYWEKQITNSPDILFTLLVLLAWATPKTIIQLFPILSKNIKALDLNEFSILAKGLSACEFCSTFNKTQQEYLKGELQSKNNHDEIKYLLSYRYDNYYVRQKYIYENIKKDSGILERIVDDKFQYLVDTYLKEPANTDILKKIKILYPKIHQSYDRHYYARQTNEPKNIPYETAKTIMQDCKSYPIMISSLAEKSCRQYANEHLTPVGKIANKEKWFDGN